MAIGTGHGATIAFTTNAFAASVLEIGGFSQERETIDTSHLGTSGQRTMIPGDLSTPGSFDVTFLFDTTVGLPSFNAAEVITITMPDTAAGTDGTIAGTGFLTSIGSPSFVTDQLMQGTYTVQWDGGTGPTVTAEATS